MAELLKKEREFVVPGDVIVKSMDYLPGKNCFREGDAIYAKKLGIVSIVNRVVSVIPLNSVYMPKVGDMVIARVIGIQPNGWIVDINSPYDAFLPLSGLREYVDVTKTDLSKIFGINEHLYAKVSMVTMSDFINITMLDAKCKRIKTGRIIKINPAKVPRLIGKKGSMVDLIKRKTKCRISIGQNGLVWIDGDKIDLVVKAIKLIEEESYINGLTDKVSKLLEGK